MVTAVAGMKANGKQHIVSRFFRYARHEHCLTGESPEQALIAGIA